ncbi:MAG: endonuclease III [Candidatus Micrarchaeota archaeon]|nr:endonuclease III [Candidatus Micrarchaeota archaeon]
MKIQKIMNVLKEYYRHRQGAVGSEHPFRVLISCVLSQRSREENTEIASKNLFRKADTPEKILKLSEKILEELIKPAGFYRQKARKIKAICKYVVKHGMPRTREELMKLPGVGPKTADVVLCYGFGIPSIAVDTHVNRISKRLGLVPENSSREEVKNILEQVFPKNFWKYVNLGFVNFGREICRPISPKCSICPLQTVCDYR